MSGDHNEEEPRFSFVLVDVPPDDSDVASYTLFELGAEGVEERDETTLVKNAVPGKVTLSASFPTRELAEEAVAALEPEINPRIEEIVGDKWRDAWKEHYKPFALCDGLVVRPPWEPYEAKAGEKVLELEPGRAFGTGLHETTSLVAAALSKRRAELPKRDVLDVGCGSGILSLVALSFGADRATAIDIDPDAIAVTLENAARNALDMNVVASVTDIAKIDQTFPVVVANIEASVLVPMAPVLKKRIAPGGFIVLSGILLPQAETVKEAWASSETPDFAIEEETARGEWTAIVVRRKA